MWAFYEIFDYLLTCGYDKEFIEAFKEYGRKYGSIQIHNK